MQPETPHNVRSTARRRQPTGQRRARQALLLIGAAALPAAGLYLVAAGPLPRDANLIAGGALLGATAALITLAIVHLHQLYRQSARADETVEPDDLLKTPNTVSPKLVAPASAERAGEIQILSTHQSEWNAALLAHMIIHDLKNPLTALIGFLDLLTVSELSDSQRLLVESAVRSSRNLTGLVDDLLDLARYNEGRLVLRHADIALQKLCADCAAEFAAWLAYESKSLSLEIPASIPPLYADPRLMQRVLFNLLSNSLKHTPYGTQIILRARYEQTDGAPRTIIEVTDNGPGIAPDQIDHIFDRFSKSDSHSARQTSTGLGLVFCKMAIAAHDGSIEVSSIPGDGATFRITLPDKRNVSGAD